MMNNIEAQATKLINFYINSIAEMKDLNEEKNRPLNSLIDEGKFGELLVDIICNTRGCGGSGGCSFDHTNGTETKTTNFAYQTGPKDSRAAINIKTIFESEIINFLVVYKRGDNVIFRLMNMKTDDPCFLKLAEWQKTSLVSKTLNFVWTERSFGCKMSLLFECYTKGKKIIKMNIVQNPEYKYQKYEDFGNNKKLPSTTQPFYDKYKGIIGELYGENPDEFFRIFSKGIGTNRRRGRVTRRKENK